MMRGAISATRRALRPLAAAGAFAFILCASAEAPLLICPECGREAAAAVASCPSCGAAMPNAATPDTSRTLSNDEAANRRERSNGDAQASSGAKAAARDVAEARRRRDNGDLAAALILFRNAQALLAAGAGTPPPADAVRAIAAEATAVERDFNNATKLSSRPAALAAAARNVETFLRGEGRIPLGRAWVPSDWTTALTPPAIAAVRLSLPPRCLNCGGTGILPCRTCAGKGSVPCKAQGCEKGWTIRKPANTLTPSSTLAIREKCLVCKGTARVTCKDCAGRGSTSCKKCGGSGEAPLCRGCNGTGLLDCRDCVKQGIRPDCPLCRGTGKVTCGKCGGDGRTAH